MKVKRFSAIFLTVMLMVSCIPMFDADAAENRDIHMQSVDFKEIEVIGNGGMQPVDLEEDDETWDRDMPPVDLKEDEEIRNRDIQSVDSEENKEVGNGDKLPVDSEENEAGENKYEMMNAMADKSAELSVSISEQSENSKKIPDVTIELKSNHEGWGLYATFSEITEDMELITPCYSLDGKNYIPEDYNEWEADPDRFYMQFFLADRYTAERIFKR